MTKRSGIIGSALSGKNVHQMSAFANTLKNRFLQIPKSVRLGVAGVSLAYLAIAGMSSTVHPWIGGSDTPRHVDYVYSVYRGELPDPHKCHNHLGSSGKKSSCSTYANGIARNGAAHTPPLHYVIMSVFSGDILDSGHWKRAVGVMRVVNIFVGLVCIFALAWGGWLIGGRYREYFAIATPAFSILITPFIRVVADVLNDPLVVLLSTSALVITIASLKLGPSTGRSIALVAICSMGMLTKATFLSTLLLVMFFLAVAYYIHNKDKIKALKYTLVTNVSILASVIVTSGWFYWRNFQISGSPMRAFPKYELIGRDKNSLTDLLLDPHFWAVIPEGLFGNFRGNISIVQPLSLLVFFIACIGMSMMVARFIKSRKISSVVRSKSHIIIGSILALMLLQIAAVYAQQLQHSIGWGLINLRYLLTALLPIGLFFAVAGLALKSYVKYIVPVMIVIYGIAAIRDIVYFRTKFDVDIDGIIQSTSSNGFSPYVICLFIIVLMIGVALVFVSTRDITNKLYLSKKKRS